MPCFWKEDSKALPPLNRAQHQAGPRVQVHSSAKLSSPPTSPGLVPAVTVEWTPPPTPTQPLCLTPSPPIST